ncbi:MAG: baseplate wedge protein, partial [Candidatus Kariarchaeaceae archaeon]
MPFTKFTNLDFDQIKTSIKDYLRANSTFTDFDFEGSNFSVLIDTLAYNTYITAFNSNMIVNESFLDSATLRENVVSLARNVGYVPRSRSAAKATVSFNIASSSTSAQIVLKAGLVCVGAVDNTSYTFSVPEDITRNNVNGSASFNNVEVYQGIYLTKEFVVDNSTNQRFILNNPNIDTSTIVVKVGTREYKQVDNIFTVDSNSEIYLLQEIADEKYELLFGDGIIGKKLETGTTVKVSYITTDGEDGNGPSLFSYSGTTTDSNDILVTPSGTVTVTTVNRASGGSSVESIESIKYFAPRVYSSQYRAVTARDYEAIIQKIYPNTESVSVVGGEELDPPQFGKVLLSIKPKNGISISDFTKTEILNDLKQYAVSGINQEIIDLKLLYVELDSDVFYNSSRVSNVQDLNARIVSSLTKYSQSVDLNKFGGRFKYSKALQVIDNVDTAITSNITRVKMRRNINCILNTFAQYEICFGNQFHKEIGSYNIKSTGFK